MAESVIRVQDSTLRAEVSGEAPQPIGARIMVDPVYVAHAPGREFVRDLDVRGSGRVAVNAHRRALRIRQVLAEVDTPVGVHGRGSAENTTRPCETRERAEAPAGSSRSPRLENARAAIERHEEGSVGEPYHVVHQLTEESLDRAAPGGHAPPRGGLDVGEPLGRRARCGGTEQTLPA